MDNIQFLSHEEVCVLTGARTKAGQIAVLARNGIRHTIKRTGWPCVISAALIGGKDVAKESSGWQPRKAG